MKKAVPGYSFPVLSAPFRQEEIAIPIVKISAMIVNGTGSAISPTNIQVLVSS